MKKLLSAIALLIGTNLVYASSIRVAENVTQNTTWAADTVFVDDTITVSSGVTLTIAPGTNVIFGRRRYLDILGVLHAVGTETDSIVFRGNMAEDYGSWDGLRFNDGRRADGVQDTSKFVYVRIMSAINHSSYRPYKAPIYMGVNTKLQILHSEIKYLYGDYGGAIFCDTASSLVIDHSVIEKCETRVGGGGAVYASLESVNLQIRNSVFRENEARYGGALYLGGGVTATIDNCVFWRNVFENPNYNDNWWGGGAVMISSSNVTMRNSLIARNSTSARGGGIAILGSSPRLINLTIALNAAYRGCGIYIRNTASRVSSPEIINTVIDRNGPSVGNPKQDTTGWAIYLDTGATAKIRYSLLSYTPVQAAGGPVTGDFENLRIGTAAFFSIFNPDPSDSIAYFLPDPYMSDLRNAGTPDTAGLGLFPTDIKGQNRIIGGRIDIGALESEADSTVFVGVNRPLKPEHFPAGEYQIRVYSLKGQLLGQFSDIVSPSSVQGAVSRRFPSGVFICRLKNGAGQIRSKRIRVD